MYVFLYLNKNIMKNSFVDLLCIYLELFFLWENFKLERLNFIFLCESVLVV